MVPVDEQKRNLRKRMRALRLVADQKDGPGAARAIIAPLLAALGDLGIGAGSVVAGYWPIVTELDDRPLLARLADREVVCALPVLVAPDAPLVFRRWRPSDPVEPGERGTWHPPAATGEVVPAAVLAPLLAFDADGYRLGQGGGHYDRTIAELRRAGRVTVIGVGFSVQRVDRVPRAANDERLDWILSEDGLRRVQA